MEVHSSQVIRSAHAIYRARAKWLFLVGTAITVADLGQQNADTVNLDSSALQVHASDRHNQSSAMHDDLVQHLQDTAASAVQKKQKKTMAFRSTPTAMGHCQHRQVCYLYCNETLAPLTRKQDVTHSRSKFKVRWENQVSSNEPSLANLEQ